MMDEWRFDRLARSLASGASRRSVVKALLGLGGAAAIGSALQDGDTDAARRPTNPTPTPVNCPGKQIASGGQCVCPDGLSKCGPDCCNPTAIGALHSECCDNACCFGECYGEELCCPFDQAFCQATGDCCGIGQSCCGTDGCCSTPCCSGSNGLLCCDSDATRCCDAGGDNRCGTCCDDADCAEVVDFPNCMRSRCDRSSGTCVLYDVCVEEGRVCCPGEDVGFCYNSDNPDACRPSCMQDSDCPGDGTCNSARECCAPDVVACLDVCCESGQVCAQDSFCCTPANCSANACGPFQSGCFTIIDCGTCDGPGEECIGGTCCVPDQNACAGKCGRTVDNCGRALNCDDCPDGQICLPESNFCCQPAICGANACGPFQSGCNTIIECGTCDAPGAQCIGGACCVPEPDAEACAGHCLRAINNCGAGVICPDCPEGQQCMDDLTCCTPSTCAAELPSCGFIDLGCATGFVRCDCPSGQFCEDGTCQVAP